MIVQIENEIKSVKIYSPCVRSLVNQHRRDFQTEAREFCNTSVTFLDINISVQDNKLATSVHYKPTDSHSYLLYSSSHPSYVRDSIPYSSNFSDSVGSAAKIQTLTPNAMKCPISFPNVAILTASCLKHSIVSKTSMENPL